MEATNVICYFSLFFPTILLPETFVWEFSFWKKRKLLSCNFVFELYFFINRHPNTLILFLYFFFAFLQQSSWFKVYFSKHLVLRGSHIEKMKGGMGRIFLINIQQNTKPNNRNFLSFPNNNKKFDKKARRKVYWKCFFFFLFDLNLRITRCNSTVTCVCMCVCVWIQIYVINGK